MKVGEVLRGLADKIDAKEAQQSAESLIQQSNLMAQQANAMAQNTVQSAMAKTVILAPEQEEVEVDNTDCTDVETMVPPLQQKHELLKKATGVENNVSEFAKEEDNEITIMKKMAGIGEPEQDRDMSEFVKPVEINPRKNAAMVHFASDNYDAE